MLTLKSLSTGKRLLLPDNHKLGGGGEGEVYRVAADPSLVAKVYFQHKLSGKEPKLRAMLANPPADPTKAKGLTSIAWPVDLLLDLSGAMVGYLMPNAHGMEKIFGYYVPTNRQRNHLGFSYKHLLSTAKNLASAVSALHSKGYVIGDVNESNIMVNNRSLVTLIDTDSFQVPDRGGRIYRCEVGKEEFTPPELQGVQFSAVDRRPEHDLFGLAVLIFQLLMEGVHPFDGKFLGAGDAPQMGARIRQGYSPYNRNRSVPFETKPTAPHFTMLSPAIQRLFLQCFADGHRDPQARPSAEVWRHELRRAFDDLANCSNNPRHHYHRDLSRCPWCERAARLGVDTFSPPTQPPKNSNTANQQTGPSVPPPTPPVINYFRASASSINAGQSLTLSWDVANAQSVSIAGVGAVAPRGNLQVSPAANATFTIEASNSLTRVTHSVAITVIPAPPVIVLFQASSASIQIGQIVTLQWQANHANTVELDNGIGAVSPQGSQTVRPQKDTTYTLTARGPGGIAQQSVRITVTGLSLQSPVTLKPPNVKLDKPAKLKFQKVKLRPVTVKLLSLRRPSSNPLPSEK